MKKNKVKTIRFKEPNKILTLWDIINYHLLKDGKVAIVKRGKRLTLTAEPTDLSWIDQIKLYFS